MTSKIIQYPPTQNPIVKTNSIEKQKNDKSSETLQKALTVAVPVVFGIGAALIYYYSKNSSAPIANMGSQENVKISTVTQSPILSTPTSDIKLGSNSPSSSLSLTSQTANHSKNFNATVAGLFAIALHQPKAHLPQTPISPSYYSNLTLPTTVLTPNITLNQQLTLPPSSTRLDNNPFLTTFPINSLIKQGSTETDPNNLNNSKLEHVYLADENGWTPYPIDKNGWTPLQAACERGDANTIRTLVQVHGVDLKELSKGGFPLLHILAEHGHNEAIKVFKELDPSLDVNQDKNGWTPLTLVAIKGKIDALNTLIGFGADPNLPNGKGWTPFQAACEYGQVDIIRTLVEKYGIDLHGKSKNGFPFLHILAERGHNKALKAFKELDPTIDMNQKDKNDLTPLTYAYSSGHIPTIETLLDLGANPIPPKINTWRFRLHYQLATLVMLIKKYI
ncbi:MAG: ankyrin repeat domain-containing protein [Rhabdochlamydiaceae bacterium]|nr:ankyrin repeat domain-containing protein [Rhabdochlamydiaceae bacterium]